MDWGQALASGIAGGAGFVSNEYQKDIDEQRWLQKQQQMMAMQSQLQRSRERYLMALEPPKTDKQTVMGDDGRSMVQNRQWIPPTDQDLSQGKGGHFEVTSTAPDINFERLQETQRQNDERNKLAVDRLDMQGKYNEARISAAQARLEAAQARGSGQGKLIRQVGPDGMAVYGTVKDGTFTPVVDEEGNPVRSQAWRKRGQFSANGTRQLPSGQTVQIGQRDEIGPSYPTNPYDDDERQPVEASKGPPSVTWVDPSQDKPLAQFTPKPKTSAAKPSSAPKQDHGKVVRTGMKDGRRVLKYEDGFIEVQ